MVLLCLGVLLYGAETWATKRVSTQRVVAFNNRCLCQIMNISRAERLYQQCPDRRNFGMHG